MPKPRRTPAQGEPQPHAGVSARTDHGRPDRHELVPVRKASDILPAYRGTPVERLLRWQNLGEDVGPRRTKAELLIGMCMDNRKVMRTPENYAFVLRTGGANLRRVEFKVSFAVAIGGVKAIALVGHDHCGMLGLPRRREEFVRGLVENGGWDREAAEEHFDSWVATFDVNDTAEFIAEEAERLRRRYPKVLVAPLLYAVGTGRLAQIVENRPN
ncbi:MAG: hypothetical protein HMLKMBBP_00245 [Planctomycetes bacterium]|nr:hypothetical protein [Planctomycetota bacterium]